MYTGNSGKTYDNLRNFNQSNISKPDILSSRFDPYDNEGIETYEKFGFDRPEAVFINNSSIIKNKKGEDLFQGCFVQWSEDWIESTDKNFYHFVYLVFVVDNMWENV